MFEQIVNITFDEMTELLREDKGWIIAPMKGIKEYVFDWKIPGTSAAVKVYTSISKLDCRKTRQNEIRVFAWDSKNKQAEQLSTDRKS